MDEILKQEQEEFVKITSVTEYIEAISNIRKELLEKEVLKSFSSEDKVALYGIFVLQFIGSL